MGKQKRLIKELEHALAQMEADWRNEHENAGCLLRSLMRNMSERATERKRHNMIVDAMAEGCQSSRWRARRGACGRGDADRGEC